jgi:hypothetical protein
MGPSAPANCGSATALTIVGLLGDGVGVVVGGVTLISLPSGSVVAGARGAAGGSPAGLLGAGTPESVRGSERGAGLGSLLPAVPTPINVD